MGLLDDAIREHLELKRRRGADPQEVLRQEQEALGPARREPEPPLGEEADPLVDEPLGLEADAQPPVPSTGTGARRFDDWDDEDFDDLVAPEPAAELDDAVAPRPVEPARPAFEAEPVAPAPEVEVPEDGDPGVDDDPAEQRGPVPVGEPPPGEHDVLEETPEFLEETPEHDRLWFEQRPPRDFDFD